jgi:putative redox protein
MTLRMYASRKSLPLEHVQVELRHSRDYNKDCGGCDEKPAQIEVIDRSVTLVGDLTAEQRERLLQIADRCPVHRTLHSELRVATKLV